MLAQMQINNQTNVSVYTCPTARRAFVYIDIFPLTSTNVEVKINNLTYWKEDGLSEFVSLKVSLTSGDEVKVSSSGTVNVFVHGMVV